MGRSSLLRGLAARAHVRLAVVGERCSGGIRVDSSGGGPLHPGNPVHCSVARVECLRLRRTLLRNGIDPPNSGTKRRRPTDAHLDIRRQGNAKWQSQPVHYATSPGSTRRLANQASIREWAGVSEQSVAAQNLTLQAMTLLDRCTKLPGERWCGRARWRRQVSTVTALTTCSVVNTGRLRSRRFHPWAWPWHID
jgi:hypothetical protein